MRRNDLAGCTPGPMDKKEINAVASVVATVLVFAFQLMVSPRVFAADAATIAAYAGPDREQFLARGAKREGEFTLYTNIAATDIEQIAAEFERRYGVKPRLWRSSPDKVLHRVLNEVRAGRFEFDALHVSTPEMEAMQREGLLVPVASPYLADLRPEARPAHKGWAASFLSVWVQAYNTAKVRKDELPRRYEDLLDPRWKDRLGIEAKNHEWFYAIVKDMGEERGLGFFRQLAANGLSVRSGTSLLNNMVVSGEVPLALTVYNFMVEQAKQKGAAIDWFVIEPAIARGNAVGVSKRSPHPHAAVLFYDFMIGPGQELLAKMHHVPTSTRAPSPFKNVRIHPVDPATVLDETERSTRFYEEIVLRRAAR